jgi:uncharacterized membrane protein
MKLPPADMKTMAFFVYGCWAIAVLSHAVHMFGIIPLIGLIIAFIKRKEAGGTIYESHFEWVIRSFVIGLLASFAVAVVFMIIPPLGMLGFTVLGLWWLWRLIKGGLRLFENKPIEDPKAFY